VENGTVIMQHFLKTGVNILVASNAGLQKANTEGSHIREPLSNAGLGKVTMVCRANLQYRAPIT